MSALNILHILIGFIGLILLALPMSPVLDFAIINIEYLDQFSLLYLILITLIFTISFSFI